MTNVNTETMTFTIKGTACNKARARTWVERRELVSYGFSAGARVDVDFGTDAITVRLNPDGKRKVSGKVNKAPILDLCEPLVNRDARFNGAARLVVTVRYGLIIITARYRLMKLHKQRDHYRDLANARKEALDNVLSYVRSQKFYTDNMVNTADIILRIQESTDNILREYGE